MRQVLGRADVIMTAWETSADILVPVDDDNNGTTDVIVFRPSNDFDSCKVAWGTAEDIPVAGGTIPNKRRRRHLPAV